jgi:hypothetical protein
MVSIFDPNRLCPEPNNSEKYALSRTYSLLRIGLPYLQWQREILSLGNFVDKPLINR